MKERKTRFLGSLYGHGAGFAGATWDTNAICPTLNTMQGGGREPHIVVKNGNNNIRYSVTSKNQKI